MNSVLERTVKKPDMAELAANEADVAAFCKDLFAYGEGAGYLDIKKHFLDGPLEKSEL